MDQRQLVRQKSLLRGIVYFDQNPCAVECVVRDISETGARVKFAEPPCGASERLELQIPIKAQRRRCRVAWRSDDELGLEFIDARLDAHDQNALPERVARLEAEIEQLKRTVRALQRAAQAAGAT